MTRGGGVLAIGGEQIGGGGVERRGEVGEAADGDVAAAGFDVHQEAAATARLRSASARSVSPRCWRSRRARRRERREHGAMRPQSSAMVQYIASRTQIVRTIVP